MRPPGGWVNCVHLEIHPTDLSLVSPTGYGNPAYRFIIGITDRVWKPALLIYPWHRRPGMETRPTDLLLASPTGYGNPVYRFIIGIADRVWKPGLQIYHWYRRPGMETRPTNLAFF